jgi:hypothetical protein
VGAADHRRRDPSACSFVVTLKMPDAGRYI